MYTKNVRSLCIHSTEKLQSVLGELSDVEWDVVLLSETRVPAQSLVLDGGHLLYTSIEDNSFAGVGILLHSKHVRKSNKIHAVGGRIMALDFMVNKIKMRVVAVYLPHLGYPVIEFNETFDQLRCVIDEGRKRKRSLIVGGDFNSQVGVGDRGAALAELQHGASLNLLNDEDVPWENQWTFRSCLGDTRKIDFLLASSTLAFSRVHATSEIDLGSDHRAVKADIHLGVARGSNQKKRRRGGWKLHARENALETYHDNLDAALLKETVHTSCTIGLVVCDAAFIEGVCCEEVHCAKPWDSQDIKELRYARKHAPNQQERSRLSKLIRKMVRQKLRKWQSEQVEQVLQEFEKLQRIEHLQRAPIIRTKCMDEVEPESFAELLRSVYESESTPNVVNREQIQQVPLFDLEEFSDVLKHMKTGRGPDTYGITLEMVKLGSPMLHTVLLDMFNDMLLRGYLDPSWHNTIFQMLPKSGDLKDPSNWRPIAILPVIYKIFSKMVCNRLRGILNEYQPDDQYAFRPNRNINDVFIILESMIGKSIEYDTPLWLVSLDLRKAFDKVEFSPLLDALRAQGISEPYVQLISELYSNQWGCVKGKYLVSDLSRCETR